MQVAKAKARIARFRCRRAAFGPQGRRQARRPLPNRRRTPRGSRRGARLLGRAAKLMVWPGTAQRSRPAQGPIAIAGVGCRRVLRWCQELASIYVGLPLLNLAVQSSIDAPWLRSGKRGRRSGRRIWNAVWISRDTGRWSGRGR